MTLMDTCVALHAAVKAAATLSGERVIGITTCASNSYFVENGTVPYTSFQVRDNCGVEYNVDTWFVLQGEDPAAAGLRLHQRRTGRKPAGYWHIVVRPFAAWGNSRAHDAASWRAVLTDVDLVRLRLGGTPSMLKSAVRWLTTGKD